MSDKDNGGPAFPTRWPRSDDAREWTEAGMSLRDYFAGQALAGMLASYSEPDDTFPQPSDAANSAFAFADALIAERAK